MSTPRTDYIFVACTYETTSGREYYVTAGEHFLVHARQLETELQSATVENRHLWLALDGHGVDACISRIAYEEQGLLLQSAESKIAAILGAIEGHSCVSTCCDAQPSAGEAKALADCIRKNLPERVQRLQEFLEAMKEAADPTSTRSPNYMWAKWRAYQGDSDG